jgi:dolichol kinase
MPLPAVTIAPAPPSQPEWPELSHNNVVALAVVNIGALIFCYVLLRIIWKPPSDEQIAKEKEMQKRIEGIQVEYGAMSSEEKVEAIAGDVMGGYSLPWKTTFDFTLLIFMICALGLLIVWTTLVYPHLWYDYMFFVMLLPKMLVMMSVALAGGLTCRYFCEVDEKGYVITNKKSKFKVNYTRKLQHFAAYMVPLLVKYKSSVSGPIEDAWGDWVTLGAFTLLIKPIRENVPFFMYQFNSLDRPEDRPETLKWIIAGNILPGLILIIFWRWALSFTGQAALAFIFIFITGIGDGLAEPVGIAFGRHKYWTSALGSNRKYQRSLEGSCCLFLGSLYFTTMFWYAFENQYQFWITMIVLPPLMTWAEAVSPHTMDTPFLMGLGGLVLFLVSHVTFGWR